MYWYQMMKRLSEAAPWRGAKGVYLIVLVEVIISFSVMLQVILHFIK
jgi:hypothetical protein